MKFNPKLLTILLTTTFTSTVLPAEPIHAYTENPAVIMNSEKWLSLNSQKSLEENEAKALKYPAEVDVNNYHVAFKVTGDWFSGYNGEIAITNNNDKPLEDWQIEFDFEGNIDAFWSAEIVSHVGNHYVVKNKEYNANINPGQTINLGFQGTPGNIDVNPGNYKVISLKDNQAPEANYKKYVENGYEVEYKITDRYHGGYNGEVVITNTGNVHMDNWSIKFDLPHEIINLWNGVITKQEGDTYLVKNAQWNQDIKVGSSVSFGLSVKCDKVVLPESCKVILEESQVPEGSYDVEFNVKNDWGSAYIGEFKLINNTQEVIEDWILEFDYEGNISEFWDADIISYVDNHYVVKNRGYNANIDANETLYLGFTGNPGNVKVLPTNYNLHQMKDGDFNDEENNEENKPTDKPEDSENNGTINPDDKDDTEIENPDDKDDNDSEDSEEDSEDKDDNDSEDSEGDSEDKDDNDSEDSEGDSEDKDDNDSEDSEEDSEDKDDNESEDSEGDSGDKDDNESEDSEGDSGDKDDNESEDSEGDSEDKDDNESEDSEGDSEDKDDNESGNDENNGSGGNTPGDNNNPPNGSGSDEEIEDAGFGTIIGKIVNEENNIGIDNAKITVDDNKVYFSDSRGNFSIEVGANATHKLKIEKEGYITEYYYNIKVEKDGRIELLTILLKPIEKVQIGDVEGRILNAKDGEVMSDITVNIRKGLNNKTGEIIATTVSHLDGTFLIKDLPNGNYTLELTSYRNIPTYFTFTSVDTYTYLGDLSITNYLNPNQMRIVLTWGKHPYDLDAYMEGAGQEIYFMNKTGVGIELDIDDVVSYGPETITIDFDELLEGTYKFSVKWCYGQGNWKTSNAKVTVYLGSEVVGEFYPPNTLVGKERWHVFELDSKTRKLTTL